MATYYPQYQLQPTYTLPITITEWNPILSTVQAPTTVYSSPALPIVRVLTTPQVVTQICPYTGVMVAEPILTTMIPSPIIADVVPVSNGYEPAVCYASEEILASNPVNIVNEETYTADEPNSTEEVPSKETQDPLEYYLTLPKELFPPARMFTLDPNPLIDEFCKLANIFDNTSWILDLEFGIPRVPVTRAIPVYDVQFNSIHCKNTPGAIHPGFESCSEGFKREILFYYDCVISAWYKGYIIMSGDKSVKNFQTWLRLPMQIFGMCWP